MSISDHVNRVAKLRATIVTVDPTQRLIEVVTADRATRQIAVWDVPNSFAWPKEGEDWSIYEENGQWMLGNRFQNPDDTLRIEDLQPGESLTTKPLQDALDAEATTRANTDTALGGRVTTLEGNPVLAPGAVLRLASTGTEHKIAWSTGAVTIVFAASSTGTVVVPHGLGSTPVNVQLTAFGTPSSGFTPSVSALDSTNITIRGVVASPITGSLFVFWMAIA